jgi:hypothetical protein
MGGVWEGVIMCGVWEGVIMGGVWEGVIMGGVKKCGVSEGWGLSLDGDLATSKSTFGRSKN